MPPRPISAAERGVTLLEALISLSVLLIGMLGMAQLQIWGVSSNHAARMHTQALDIARELAAGLERLPPNDPILTPHFVTADLPPEGFGRRIKAGGTVATDGYTKWDDAFRGPAGRITGVRPDTAIPLDARVPGTRAFQRAWSIWEIQTAAPDSAVKLIAVSVVYREKAFPAPREVVVHAYVVNSGATVATATAYR